MKNASCAWLQRSHHACNAADLVITHALEWPSLTVQWFPVRVSAE